MSYTRREHPHIASGRKTMTRYLITEPRTVARPGPRGLQRSGKSATRETRPFVPTVGALLSYTVPSSRERMPGDPPETEKRHVVITEVREELLGAITFKDVRAEGHNTTDDFKLAWVRRHDKAWTKSEQFARAAAFGDESVQALILARFERRWAGVEVYVVRFERTESKLRYMASGPVAGKSGDYTTSPVMSIERGVHCVDAATQERISRAARDARDANVAKLYAEIEAERLEQRRRRSLGRLAELKARAKRRAQREGLEDAA